MITDIEYSPLATIEKVQEVRHHPNADRLDIINISNYICIVGRDEYKIGDYTILIRPDSVLPDEEWSLPYRKFCKNRVKAQKLRGEWSFGIAIQPKTLGIVVFHPEYELGMDVTDFLRIKKYICPEIENRLDIRRAGLPYSIPKTDEKNFQSIENLSDYFGQKIDVTEKLDGQSCSVYLKNEDFGICSRTTDYKIDCDNNFTRHIERYNLRNKLEKFCKDHNVNLALRGESVGPKIQGFKHNRWSKGPCGLYFFSVFNLDTLEYERRGSPLYIHNIAKEIGIDAVPILEQDVIFDMDLIRKYRDLEKLNDQYIEGVVIQGENFSCKVINFMYDSLK